MPSSEFIEFFLNADSCLIQYELIELSHPNASKTYRLCRNCTKDGLFVRHKSSDSFSQFYQYLPMRITPKSRENNLDFGITVSISDVGNVFPEEIRRIDDSENYAQPPKLVYRSYRSDNLTEPMYGPFTFNIYSISFDSKGATFDGATSRLNTVNTGQFYDPSLEEYEIIRSLT